MRRVCFSWPRAAPNRKQWLWSLGGCPAVMGSLDQALRDPTLSPHGSACGQGERSKLPASTYGKFDRYTLAANIPKGRELRASCKPPRKDRCAALRWHSRKPGEGLNSGQRSRVCDTWGSWVGVIRTTLRQGRMGCGMPMKGGCEHSRASIMFMKEALVNIDCKSFWLSSNVFSSWASGSFKATT